MMENTERHVKEGVYTLQKTIKNAGQKLTFL